MRPFNLGGFICLQFSIAWGIGTVLAIRVLHSTLAVIVEGSVITRAVVKILSFAGINATLDSVIFTDVLLGIAYLIFAVDFIVTLACVIGLNRKLDELDEISKKLSVVSENLSEKLGSKALETDQKLDESRVQASLARAELRDKADQWREERQEAKEERREKLEKFFTEKIQQNYASYEERINEITEMARELTEKQLELEQRSRELRAQISSKSFMGGRRIIKAHPTIRHEQHRAILDDIRKKIK